MPPLRTDEGIAESTQDKATALRKRFYPTTSANLTDITDPLFIQDSLFSPLPVEKGVTAEEVLGVLCTRRPFKAPGNDSIPNGFLRTMGLPLAQAIATLTTACWRLEHYPARFKEARTVVIRKPNKSSYDEPSAWRPIALLNTIGKLIESLTAKRIQGLAEEYNLLPEAQMGGRKNRSTETALDLLT